MARKSEVTSIEQPRNKGAKGGTIENFEFRIKKSQSLVTSAATKEKVKALHKELADYERAMAEKIATESRARLKQRFNYPVFLYEAEHVGITATGEPDLNELYPNERQPAGGVKTCVELYREFRKAPESFFADGPAE